MTNGGKSKDVYTKQELFTKFRITDVNEIECRPHFEVTPKPKIYRTSKLTKDQRKLKNTFTQNPHGIEMWHNKELTFYNELQVGEKNMLRAESKNQDTKVIKIRTFGNGEDKRRTRKKKIYLYKLRIRDICQKKMRTSCTLNENATYGKEKVDFLKKTKYGELSKMEIEQLKLLGYTNPTKQTGKWERKKKNIIGEGSKICQEQNMCLDYVPRLTDIPRNTKTI